MSSGSAKQTSPTSPKHNYVWDCLDLSHLKNEQRSQVKSIAAVLADPSNDMFPFDESLRSSVTRSDINDLVQKVSTLLGESIDYTYYTFPSLDKVSVSQQDTTRKILDTYYRNHLTKEEMSNSKVLASLLIETLLRDWVRYSHLELHIKYIVERFCENVTATANKNAGSRKRGSSRSPITL